jgi:fido (protein-threonine AMPylation protein)
MGVYKWNRIEPLSDKERAIDVEDFRPLYNSWRAAKERIKQSSPAGLKTFTDRLIRSLSIETGILERIYDIDVGTTQILVMQGFVEDLVTRSSTSIEPSLLINILRDQESAVRLVMDCVSESRQLNMGVVNQLHSILTNHQPTTKAVDQFGNIRDVPLLSGAFKTQPNNPMRRDGEMHEYCPPIHVASEMDNLVSWYSNYEKEDPLITAAWFHHRFTQIHPYQDGNGRVVRALITLILLKADLLPLVIDRNIRVEYIDALERADHGELSYLVKLFATLEKRAILQALSIDLDSNMQKEMLITRAVIENLPAKWQKIKKAKDEQLRNVNKVAKSLRDKSVRIIQDAFNSIVSSATAVRIRDNYVSAGGPDFKNQHWYKYEIVESTKDTGKWVNFGEDHYFVKAAIRVNDVRLVYVVSAHHIGRELSGIMEITAFASIEYYEDENDKEPTQTKSFECSLEPFVIAWNTTESDVLATYGKWLDTTLAIAIKEWGDRI